MSKAARIKVDREPDHFAKKRGNKMSYPRKDHPSKIWHDRSKYPKEEEEVSNG